MSLRDKFSLFIIVVVAALVIKLSPLYALSDIPTPPNSEETKQETRMLGNSEYDFIYYSSALGANQIKEFYRQHLPESGWKEKKILDDLKQVQGFKVDTSLSNALGQNLIFEKDTDMLIINFLPPALPQKGATRFTLALGKSIIREVPPEEADFIPKLIAEPKKDVFPVYPDASLISLSEPENTIKATYFSKDNIHSVAEFYKVKMLNYGWSLIGEKPAEKIDTSLNKEEMAKYCPTCADKAAISPGTIENWLAQLYFSNQNQDTCNVILSQVITGEGMPNMEMTVILVDYAEKKE